MKFPNENSRASRGAVRERLACRRRIFFGVFPSNGYGKAFPFVYRGMGTGREGGKAEA